MTKPDGNSRDEDRALADKSQVEQMLADHAGMLWRIASIYEADPELRKELHQEILVAAWRAVPRFRGEASVRTFLARIAHIRSVSHVARQAARPRHTPIDPQAPSPAASPYDEAEQSDRRSRLLAAVRDLPLAWRQPIVLTLEGFAPREIGEVLGLSANVVSIRLTRAKHALRQSLKEPS